MIFPKSWRPVEVADLIRVGPKVDGGYCVSKNSVLAAEFLLSFGLFDDWRFEAHFGEINQIPINCYDHTVDGRFWIHHFVKSLLNIRMHKIFQYFKYKKFFSKRHYKHIQKKIGYDESGSISLNSIMANLGSDNVFLKVDIEGGEYRILSQIVHYQDRFSGIVLEFHDIDLHEAALRSFISDLDRHSIVWIHGNNYGGVTPDGNPLVLEMSFCRSDLIDNARIGSSILDVNYPNNPEMPEMALTFASV